MSTQPTRRPRAAKPEEPQHAARLAPAFDRDALTLAHLCTTGYLSRREFRNNLRLLGVQLEDEAERRLPVPTVVRIEATYPPAVPAPESAGAVLDALDADDDEPWEPWEPWKDDEEGS